MPSFSDQFPSALPSTLMLASKGVTGVPCAVLVVLLATASALHIPTAPILLILGIDSTMDMGMDAHECCGQLHGLRYFCPLRRIAGGLILAL